MLLEREVDLDRPDSLGWTSLSAAARYGHEKVVKMLLERDVNPDKPDNLGWTPLSHAAQLGREGVVKILLGWDDVNPQNLDKDGKTPLDRAAEKGHQAVIALLQPPESAAPSQCSQASQADSRALRDGSPFRPVQVVLACRALASVFRKDGSHRG